MITSGFLFVIAAIICATISLLNMLISTTFPKHSKGEASPYINKAYIFLILTLLLFATGILIDTL